MVQAAVQPHDPRHDGRQDHRDVPAGLASNPQVMSQECSFAYGGGRAAFEAPLVGDDRRRLAQGIVNPWRERNRNIWGAVKERVHLNTTSGTLFSVFPVH